MATSGSSKEIASAVGEILKQTITSEDATLLASSEKVLLSVSADQASQIFDEITVSELTPEQEDALVGAVNEAPESVKNAFESSIDVFGSGLDTYVPVGSLVNVGTRRTVVASVTAVGAAGAAVAGTTGEGRTSDTDRNSSSGAQTDLQLRDRQLAIARRQARRLNQNRSGPSGAGLLGGAMPNSNKSRTLFGVLAKEIAGLSFTLAGSMIVLVTLSGTTRKVGIIATSVALVLHFVNVLVTHFNSTPD